MHCLTLSPFCHGRRHIIQFSVDEATAVLLTTGSFFVPALSGIFRNRYRGWEGPLDQVFLSSSLWSQALRGKRLLSFL